MTTTATLNATKPVAAGRHRKPAPSLTRRTATLASRIASLLTALLLITAALVLLAMTIGPRVLHYRTATMLTGSMAPKINPGDVVVDTQEPVAEVAIGQIITYHIPVDDHRVESHRVIWVGHDKSGHVLIRTKGDANPIADPWTAQLGSGPVWRVRTVVPMAGALIRTLQKPIVHLLLVLALPAALLIGLLIAIWSPAKTDDDTKDAQNQDVPSENVQNKTGRNKDAQENRSVRKHNRDRGAGAGDLGVQPDQGQQDVLTRVGRDA